MCVDYQALNAFLPQVTNPTTKAKGVLTFVLLPRIGKHCHDAILSAMQGSGFTQDPEVLDYLRLPVDGSPPPATMPINQELDAAKFLPEGFTTSELITYQREDDFCQEQLERIESDKAPTQVIPFFYLDEDQRLCRTIKTGYKVFDTLVIPTKLVPLVLDQIHHLTGHNGTPQTFEFTCRLFWWPSMLHDIKAACKQCPSCQQMNRMPQQYHALSLHMPLQPLQLVAMDLIGPFTETSAGHKYALTIMDMLTSYLWAIPLRNKSADHVARSFITHFYTREGSVVHILTDNGTEFKNKLFREVAKMLDFDHVFTSPYHPQGNGKLEAAHRFLKDCTWKWLQNCPLEWDEILPNAMAAYNFMPNQNSLDSPFFLL